ncbi:MAG: ATP synthase F1 subunit delta [Coriobacteriales bacterium]|jgi:F-type H+-transporting ATPase subunit delta|nr:ATP synthase F1 subunit delta [Coriobacteriales bacterium]
MSTDRTLAKAASQVYAANLLEASKAKGNILEITAEMEQIFSTVIGNVDLRNTLSDHAIPVTTRQSIASEVFAGYDEVLLAVFSVIVQRNDIMLLSRVAEAYLELAEQALGAIIIDVTTVVSLDDDLRRIIKDKYAAQLGSDVILREHVDKGILGGIILSTHGRRIDASVVSQLENARVTLSKRN